MIHSEMIERMTVREFNERIIARKIRMEEQEAVKDPKPKQQTPEQMLAVLRTLTPKNAK